MDKSTGRVWQLFRDGKKVADIMGESLAWLGPSDPLAQEIQHVLLHGVLVRLGETGHWVKPDDKGFQSAFSTFVEMLGYLLVNVD